MYGVDSSEERSKGWLMIGLQAIVFLLPKIVSLLQSAKPKAADIIKEDPDNAEKSCTPAEPVQTPD